MHTESVRYNIQYYLCVRYIKSVRNLQGGGADEVGGPGKDHLVIEFQLQLVQSPTSKVWGGTTTDGATTSSAGAGGASTATGSRLSSILLCFT